MEPQPIDLNELVAGVHAPGVGRRAARPRARIPRDHHRDCRRFLPTAFRCSTWC
jgi:hypothetical protein